MRNDDYTPAEMEYHAHQSRELLRLQGATVESLQHFWRRRSKPGKMYRQALAEALKSMRNGKV